MRNLILILLALGIIWSGGIASKQDKPKQLKSKELLKRIDRKIRYGRARIKREIKRLISDELDLARGKKVQSYPEEVQRALQLISSDFIERYIYHLCHRRYRSRVAGTKGGRLASKFIAEEFRHFGLKPVGDKDKQGNPSYFQRFHRRYRNCVGVLEGRDEELREEVIVVGGHHDHTPENPGANDNASGSVVVLSLARAFGLGGLRPKRTILFMTFDYEEGGLNGSRYYVKRPIYPKYSHVLMLNFDMVGHKTRGVEGTGSFRDKKLVESIIKGAARYQGLKLQIRGTRRVSRGSDGYSFAQARIPTISWLMNGPAHGGPDPPERIFYDHMERITKVSLLLLWRLANLEEFPRARGKPRGIGKPIGAPLKVLSKEVSKDLVDQGLLREDQGGLRVASVKEGTFAARAGLKAGDIIIEFAGKQLPKKGTKRRFTRLKRKIKNGSEVQIVVIRNNRKEVLKGIW